MSRVETANKTNPQHTAVHVAATGADCHWKDDSGEASTVTVFTFKGALGNGDGSVQKT